MTMFRMPMVNGDTHTDSHSDKHQISIPRRGPKYKFKYSSANVELDTVINIINNHLLICCIFVSV